MSDGSVVRTVVWESRLVPGMERCSLLRAETGWALAGTVVSVLDGAPVEARYRVDCDGGWRTRSVEASVDAGGRKGSVRMLADQSPSVVWRRDGSEVPEVTGCVDVDLGITPSTNTLPIRRLDLQVGQSAEVRAAWMGFPDLDVGLLEQRYTRVGADRYRYESLAGGASYEISVDDMGLVVDYEDLFVRLAVG